MHKEASHFLPLSPVYIRDNGKGVGAELQGIDEGAWTFNEYASLVFHGEKTPKKPRIHWRNMSPSRTGKGLEGKRKCGSLCLCMFTLHDFLKLL